MPLDRNADKHDARAAGSQSLFREINERVYELNRSFAQLVELGDWICECTDVTCVELVEMSMDEYEAIRRDANSFFVVPNEEHVSRDVERITKQTRRYWIVEKIDEAREPVG
jgi:hypothetical protein